MSTTNTLEDVNPFQPGDLVEALQDIHLKGIKKGTCQIVLEVKGNWLYFDKASVNMSAGVSHHCFKYAEKG